MEAEEEQWLPEGYWLEFPLCISTMQRIQAQAPNCAQNTGPGRKPRLEYKPGRQTAPKERTRTQTAPTARSSDAASPLQNTDPDAKPHPTSYQSAQKPGRSNHNTFVARAQRHKSRHIVTYLQLNEMFYWFTGSFKPRIPLLVTPLKCELRSF